MWVSAALSCSLDMTTVIRLRLIVIYVARVAVPSIDSVGLIQTSEYALVLSTSDFVNLPVEPCQT